MYNPAERVLNMRINKLVFNDKACALPLNAVAMQECLRCFPKPWRLVALKTMFNGWPTSIRYQERSAVSAVRMS